MNQPIGEADNGAAVTVLCKNRYRALIYEHFSNENTYQKLGKNLNPTIMKKLKKLSNKQSTKVFSQLRSLST